MILFINSCVRPDSRTERLARKLLNKLGGEYKELRLENMELEPLNGERLARRDALVAAGKFDDPSFALAREFAAADAIVIAAPLWDMCFPALLKVYLERVYVNGITASYTIDGRTAGLCRAKKLWYVSTSGGPFVSEFGWQLVDSLARNFFGIPETGLLYAEMTDVMGYDPEAILREAIEKYDL